MTRMQEMSLEYHFTVEQEEGSATHAFFGFNGTYISTISLINISSLFIIISLPNRKCTLRIHGYPTSEVSSSSHFPVWLIISLRTNTSDNLSSIRKNPIYKKQLQLQLILEIYAHV